MKMWYSLSLREWLAVLAPALSVPFSPAQSLASAASTLWYRDPALTRAWRDGSERGLRARGGFAVDVHRRNGALATATIVSTHGTPCTVRARAPFQLGAARSRAEGSDHVLEFPTVAGKTYEITSQP
ncbi:MAG: hypothetical protein RLZZ15_2586 [Verrucomicrobiota bacterium]|jgi:hypothetical protein